MQIIHSDTIVNLEPNEKPNYDNDNPLDYLYNSISQMQLAVEREHYLPKSIQYLFPLSHLSLYPSQNANDDNPIDVDNKEDFQHQNIQKILYADSRLLRGWVNVNNQTIAFIGISYRGDNDSILSQLSNNTLNESIKLWLKVGEVGISELIDVPYNPVTDRYEIELWGYNGNDIEQHLDEKGLSALQDGRLVMRPDLIKGNIDDFSRNSVEEQEIGELHTESSMHPIRSLTLQLAWSNHTQTHWDSLYGANYQYRFGMRLRGWDNYLKVGLSRNPHGGSGLLHYRNLFSNYRSYSETDYADEANLRRDLEPWMQNAFGDKNGDRKTENFFKVDYMDMHILKPDCGIGLHRHRDNQEAFLMLEGEGLMVIGDWNKMNNWQRSIEVRTLDTGSMVMLRGGNLHALINTRNESAMLFIFGGYD